MNTRTLRRALLSPYHFGWALGSALYYGFPGHKLVVIGVTGTKGKSSVAEMLHAVLQKAGHKTALAGTIRFAYGEESKPNLFKMTLPGRGFAQAFLAEAVQKECTHVVIEITSEAAVQYRHLFLGLNALIFTNLQKEHLESHGSFEKYFEAKMRIGSALERSMKRPRAIIANADDQKGRQFLELAVENTLPFSYKDVTQIKQEPTGTSFSFENTLFTLRQPGAFTVLNALAVIKTARWLGVSFPDIANALAGIQRIPGRVERIEEGQAFTVVVDYAHTPDSLEALYSAFPQRKICVLGNTGGGRDLWKRKEMGRIADEACAHMFLTNEDPYDEDPARILQMMAEGATHPPTTILDRRAAIHAALKAAQPGDAVLISGKGTDPFIMGPNGSKIPWSDAAVVREELKKIKENS